MDQDVHLRIRIFSEYVVHIIAVEVIASDISFEMKMILGLRISHEKRVLMLIYKQKYSYIIIKKKTVYLFICVFFYRFLWFLILPLLFLLYQLPCRKSNEQCNFHHIQTNRLEEISSLYHSNSFRQKPCY